MLTLGDRLMQLGQFDGAHVCYLMCGCPIGTNWNLPTRLLLLGCDHNIPLHSELMTPESIECFLCTEAFEWARRRGNKRTCLQSLQTFKLRYAELLADFGHVDLAREYVVSIRQLTGIGLDDNASSQFAPTSGNILVPVYPDDFIDRLYRFEDRLCVLTGAELSCKRKEEEHRKSALSAITGGLGSVFGRKPSDANSKGLQQEEKKLDEPSSENEFMDMIEKKREVPASTSSETIGNLSGEKNSRAKSLNDAVSASTAPPVPEEVDAPKPTDSQKKPPLFNPFTVAQNVARNPVTETPSGNTGQTGDFPPVSAPPSLGDDAPAKISEPKSEEQPAKLPSPMSTPAKQSDTKAPSSEPPSKLFLPLIHLI